MVKGFVRVAFYSDLYGVRFLLALGAMLIGTSFLWPSNIFIDPFTGVIRPTYKYMNELAPEWVWGVSFFVQGIVMMWSLLTDRRSKLLLWADGVAGCFLWTTAIVACYASHWTGGNILDYRLPAIMGGEVASVLASWWVLVRYSVDEDKHG